MSNIYCKQVNNLMESNQLFYSRQYNSIDSIQFDHTQNTLPLI
jgi:hypothetical protein